MKKTLSIFFLALLAVLTSCGGNSTTVTSQLKVVGKDHSGDYKEYWIIAYDFNNQPKEEAFKILVQEEMVWNLIEEGKEYFAVYEKKDNESWLLQQIEHIDSDNMKMRK